MKQKKLIITCDGPTCREFVLINADVELPGGWWEDLNYEDAHYHTELCYAFAVLSKELGEVEGAKDMTSGEFLREMVNYLGIPQADSRPVVDNTEQLALYPSVHERKTKIEQIIGLLQDHPGEWLTTTDLDKMGRDYGYNFPSYSMSANLSTSNTQQKYPQLKVRKATGPGRKNEYMWPKEA